MLSNRLRTACIAAGLTTLALAGLSPAAQAGTYRQYTCKLPDGTPAGTDGWVAQSAAAGFVQADTCIARETLRTQMEGIGMPVNSQRVWRWSAPTDTNLQAVELYRSFSLAAGDTNGTPTISIDSGSQRVERHGSSLAIGTGVASAGVFSAWNAPSNRLIVNDPPSLAANELTLMLGCTGGAGRSCPNTGAARSEVHMHAATFTLEDTLAPTISNVGGLLTTAAPKQGIATLQFDATDAGAGIYRTFLDVDGTTVATSTPNTNNGHCADAVPANADAYEFQHRVPCPLSLSAVHPARHENALRRPAHAARAGRGRGR